MKIVSLSARSVFILALVMISHSAFSWGLTGHRVVGRIAQAHLSKKAKKEIKLLIGHESLAWWANWSDFIKSDSTNKSKDPWHYVDLPGHMSKDSFIAALKLLPGKNLYTQIIDMKQQLGNRSLPVEQRRIALYWMIHLMGDLHQPLHVGRDEDEGGNKIVVYWFGQKTNLHSLWDSKLIESQVFSFSEYASELDVLSKEANEKLSGGTLEDWFADSHEMSDRIYDASPNEAKLGYQYNYDFKDLLDGQLRKGGLRLAKILNEAFD
ncbi:MAG: S1/P1 Nuclease [Chitinophagaceae bacterium]|nr:MAG: S1/P1 Nuclease [Chitinophagaceae bacterium]